MAQCTTHLREVASFGRTLIATPCHPGERAHACAPLRLSEMAANRNIMSRSGHASSGMTATAGARVALQMILAKVCDNLSAPELLFDRLSQKCFTRTSSCRNKCMHASVAAACHLTNVRPSLVEIQLRACPHSRCDVRYWHRHDRD